MPALPISTNCQHICLASDKCNSESECLSFEQHMQVTSSMWQKHIDQGNKRKSLDPTVVFTTESTSMVKEQQAFISQKGETKFPFKFDFVTNTKDVTPDSGFMKDIGKTKICWIGVTMTFHLRKFDYELTPNTFHCCSPP
jgi:hypothetical protein